MDRYGILLEKEPPIVMELDRSDCPWCSHHIACNTTHINNIWTSVSLKPGQVWALIKKFRTRPDHWNYQGYMDCFMGTWVLLELLSTDDININGDFNYRTVSDRYWLFKRTDIEDFFPRGANLEICKNEGYI